MIKALSFIKRVDRYFFLLHWKVELSLGILTREAQTEADLLQSVSAAQQSVQNTGTYCSRDRYVASQSDSDRSQQTSEPAFNLTPYLLVLFGQMQRSSHLPEEINGDDADELMEELILHLSQKGTFHYYYWNAKFNANILFFFWEEMKH